MGVISNGISNGISMGTALAMIISYIKGNNLLFVIVHGLLSWFYVVYHFLGLSFIE